MPNILKYFFIIISIVLLVLVVLLSAFTLTGHPAFVESMLPHWTVLQDEKNEEVNEDAQSADRAEEGTVNAAGSGNSDNWDDLNDLDESLINPQTENEAAASGSSGALMSEDIKESEPDSKTATLAFAGDVMFSDAYLNAYDQSGISAIADDDMLKAMRSADLFILNEEFPFSLRGEPMADKQFTFRTDPKYVQIFKELGADIVSLANNHALDYGRDAFCDTLTALDQAGIKRIGGGFNIAEASAPAVCTVNGLKFAIFGATRVAPSADWYAGEDQAGLFQTYEPSRLNAAIQTAKKSCDYVIVFVHWGVEKKETPEEYQRTLAKGYIDAGADLVVGCHPHVLQGFEYYKGVPIVYSLGNYLFDNRTGETLLLETSFSEDKPVSVRLVPCQRSGNGVLARLQNQSASELYQKLTGLSFDAAIDDNGILQPAHAAD